MRFTLLSGFLRIPRLAGASGAAAPKRTALVSALSFALLLSLAAPQARAATQACKEGAKATIDGLVITIIYSETKSWLLVRTPDIDCSPVMLTVKGKAEQCPLASEIHTSGTLSKPDGSGPYLDWNLSDTTDGKGARYEETISCRNAPPMNPLLKPWAKTK